MDVDERAIARVVERAVRDRDGCEPGFYAVTGSRLYGFASEDHSDVDVRGFHLADGRRYALLDRPAEQFVVDRDGVATDSGDPARVDLVSYELRKFGRLVSEANFNVLEAVCCGDPVVDAAPEALESLRSLLEARLPPGLAASYYGMARTNYRRHLRPGADDGDRTAKTYLYVLRGLLAARHVLEAGAVEADVRALADAGGETALVEDLIAARRRGASAAVPEDLAARADERIGALFEDLDPPDPGETSDYRTAVDEWMRGVRGWEASDP